jgi:hypothetical protein
VQRKKLKSKILQECIRETLFFINVFHGNTELGNSVMVFDLVCLFSRTFKNECRLCSKISFLFVFLLYSLISRV